MLWRRWFATAVNKQVVVNVVPGYPPVRLHLLKSAFGGDLAELKKSYEKLQTLGLSKKEISRLVAKRADLFKPDAAGKQSIDETIANITKEEGPQWLHSVANNPKLLQKENVLEDSRAVLRDFLRLNDVDLSLLQKQIERILKYFPRTVNMNLRMLASEKKTILQEYLHLNQQEIADLVSHIPFLINIKTQVVRDFLQFLVGHNFSKQQVLDMVKLYPELLAVERMRLDRLYSMPIKWGVTPETVCRTILENPEYLLVCPFEVMPLKIKLLKHFKVSQQTAKYMFENHPQIFILSVSSLETKLLFLRDKLRLDLNSITDLYPWILTRNYNGVLRPRGELLNKYGLNVNRKQFECSDEEFCAGNNLNPELLTAAKSKYSITNERDYRRKFFSSELSRMRRDGSLPDVFNQLRSGSA